MFGGAGVEQGGQGPLLLAVQEGFGAAGAGGQRGGALALPGGVPLVDGLPAHAEQAGDRGLGELTLVEQLRGDQAPFLVLGRGSGRGEGKLHEQGFPSSLGRQPTHQRSVLTHLSTAKEATGRVLDFLDLYSSTDEWEEGSALVHRVLELAEQGTGTAEEWHLALDAVLVFAARQDSQYLDSEDDKFDVAAALAVARATGLVKGYEAEVKPAGNGRPQSWVPRLG
ncbi:hypothetical protein HNR07_003462 [Nocardiopsis metallicus]|uniref:Uncharacterized protein n=1 Tax=Nocardiopsis metallicus TaxID=179819 RepID=A0A840WKE8_9ACTN|nr:hypothetical protein [Nocardiopsis metallicus]MBB5492325.1 hypothetical protein [Nocardiopsis metallicus]